jgi:hypothetical protein
MANYFQSLPSVTYGRQQLRNILYRPRLLKNIDLVDPSAFYPYLVKQGETIEQIAFFYYGDVQYVWLVMFANDIIDPYYQWYMSTREFENYIASKYGSISAAQAIVIHKKDADGNLFSTDTTTSLISGTASPISEVPVLTNVTAYDIEVEENENRKHIVLIDKQYIPQIDRELRKLYNA